MASNGHRYTPFGMYVRRLRLETGYLLKDMANATGFSSAWLSSVETGRKSVPNELISKVITFFKLDEEEAQELRERAKKSRDLQSLRKIPNDRRDVAASLARNFNKLEANELDQLRELLKKSEK